MTQPVTGPRGSWQWGVCGASVVGSEHQRRGLGCDDAYCFGITEDFVVAAVADGAGSVTGTSAWGAYTACQSVLANAMRSRFIHEFRDSTAEEAERMLRALFEKATEHVHAQAQFFGLDSAKLATTLCVALADRDRAAFGQIGDGVIATQTEDRIETLLIEAKDDYQNATWFLQSDGAFEESFRTVVRPAVTAFALSTDGMTYKITNVASGEAYEPFFRGSWERVRAGATSANFASLLRGIEDDQTGDDKTMVLATLRWEDDDYYPSPTPVTKMTASSPRPPVPAAKVTDAQVVPAEPAPAPQPPEPAAEVTRPPGETAPAEPDTTPIGQPTARPRLFRRSAR
ncbi:PP2C family serine/threonine-protein phosphatase [Mycolicibacterium sp. ELW1]|uniref:PP2C family serine/threonine-protein phosphatase n=1 Tax=Mycobacteriaceae TaxID=1762 RepID=UPI0011EBD58D|nr:PP2C family serine/threonine-protein phosphatase [Mycobacterium sp. ELW1]QEN11966.1 protein phosphatase 2C domain-containing protein [Mycobacterium sp. ELW1]